MLFNSLAYFVFFPVVLLLYFAAPQRHRWAVALGASYFFYASWRPEYLGLILAATLVAYLGGLATGRTAGVEARRRRAGAAIAAILAMLFVFKYFDFFTTNVQSALAALDVSYQPPRFDLLLPVGISFYSFQAIGYVMDVARGERPPERHLGYFALFVSFFPQLVAGPIERADRLLPQLVAAPPFEPTAFTAGMRRILWGLFKKVVVADRLAVIVDQIYSTPDEHPGWVLALGTFLFAFQIYADFSGYSDIAIGTAQAMGIRLVENFNFPYVARSISDFWRRWHMSLYAWLHDYVYIGLGGNRKGPRRRDANILAVFLLSGLWHGAAWHFVAWGGMHGVALVLESRLSRAARALGIRAPTGAALGIVQIAGAVATFVLVLASWVFFRAGDLTVAARVFAGLATGWGSLFDEPSRLESLQAISASGGDVLIAIVLAIVLWLEPLFRPLIRLGQRPSRTARTFRWAFYLAAGTAVLSLGVVQQIPFIYFQF